MSDLLYHVKRTIIRYDEDPSGATRDVDILGTFTDLAAAKAAANAGLAVSLISTCPTLFPLTTPSYISVLLRFKKLWGASHPSSIPICCTLFSLVSMELTRYQTVRRLPQIRLRRLRAKDRDPS